MPRRARPAFREKDLSRGELRKLNALKKSLGEDIALRAFGEWYSRKPDAAAAETDKVASLITGALTPLIKRNKLQLPRGGYVLRRGRGRIIVERVSDGK